MVQQKLGGIMGYEGNDKAVLRNIENRKKTKHMQTLLGICSGIIADNEINEHEMRFLSAWLSEDKHKSVINNWPGNVIADRVRNILKDGIITAEEKTHLLETLKQITGNYFAETGSVQNEILGIDFSYTEVIFSGMHFCFTGEFIYGPRKKCNWIIEDLGGIPLDRITKKLDYLVVGNNTSPEWTHESYGNKIEQALEYRNKYTLPDIISEQQWIQAIKHLTMQNQS